MLMSTDNDSPAESVTKAFKFPLVELGLNVTVAPEVVFRFPLPEVLKDQVYGGNPPNTVNWVGVALGCVNIGPIGFTPK